MSSPTSVKVSDRAVRGDLYPPHRLAGSQARSVRSRSGGEVPRNGTYRALAMLAANSQASESVSVAAATVLRARPRLGLVATAAGLVAAPGDDAGDEHPNEQTAQNHPHAGYT
jgi:hypothetical protein